MLDAEIHKLDNLDGKDLAKIREERHKQLKERKLEEAEWSRHGHGHLTQLTETKEFFAASKNSRSVGMSLHETDVAPLRRRLRTVI